MNDVAACFAQQHFGANRNYKLTRSDDRLCNAIFVIRRVVVLPPPLLTGHVDDHLRVARLVQIKHGAERKHTNYGQNECWDDGQRDFECRVAVALFWNRLTFVAKLDDAVNNGSCNDQPDDSGNCENWFLQRINFLRVRTFWLECVLWCIGRTACKKHCSCSTENEWLESTYHPSKHIDLGCGIRSVLDVVHGTTTTML